MPDRPAPLRDSASRARSLADRPGRALPHRASTRDRPEPGASAGWPLGLPARRPYRRGSIAVEGACAGRADQAVLPKAGALGFAFWHPMDARGGARVAVIALDGLVVPQELAEKVASTTGPDGSVTIAAFAPEAIRQTRVESPKSGTQVIRIDGADATTLNLLRLEPVGRVSLRILADTRRFWSSARPVTPFVPTSLVLDWPSRSSRNGNGPGQALNRPAGSSDITELHATLLGRDGSAMGLSGEGEGMTVPSANTVLARFRSRSTIRPGGPMWSFIFSDDGGNQTTSGTALKKGCTVEIDPVGHAGDRKPA